MPAQNPHVVVAIVGYRNLDDIRRCAAALASSTYTNFEVVICENGGSAGQGRAGCRPGARPPWWSAITVIEAAENLGYAGGVNVCMRHSADADAWWILNPDTQPASGALAALVARLGVGDCELVGGPLCGEDGEVQSRGFVWRSWLARASAIGRDGRLDDPPLGADLERRLSFISGASMLVGRTFVATVGYMREDYFLYAEEVEWCLRGLARGMRLGFAPGGVIVHHAGSTTGSGEAIAERSRMPIYLDERNKLLVTRDHFPRRLPVAMLGSLLLLGLRYAAAAPGDSSAMDCKAGWPPCGTNAVRRGGSCDQVDFDLIVIAVGAKPIGERARAY